MNQIRPHNTQGTDKNAESAAPGGLPGRADAGFWTSAVLIIALAAALRFLHISRYEIWLDEAYGFILARKSVAGILSILRFDNGPPLHYVLLHYWVRVFGTGPWGLRSLSAVFSTASVAVVLFWNTPWFSRKARLLAGFVFAITPLAIYYAQETRMYAPALFFVLLSAVFLERGLRVGKFLHWALFGLFTALSFYTSYVAVFFQPLGYLAILFQYARENDLRATLRRLGGLVGAHIFAAALFAPWLPVFFQQPSGTATQWMKPMWMAANKPLLPFHSLSVMTTGGAYYPKSLRYLAQGPERTEEMRQAVQTGRQTGIAPKVLTKVPAVVPLVAMAALSVWLLYSALAGPGGPFPHKAFLVLWIAVSLLGPFVLSFAKPVYFVGRYELTGIPAFVMLCGMGAAAMKRRARQAALLLATLLFLYSWGYMLSFPRSGVYPDKGRAVANATERGDVSLCVAFEYMPVYYYTGARRDEITTMIFPRDMINHPGWIDHDKWLEPPLVWNMPAEALFGEAREALLEAASKAGPGGRVVIVRPVIREDPGGGRPRPWFDALNRALGGELARLVESGDLEVDRAASRGDLGIVVMRVSR